MFKVGLTGGIGSGKTTVARIFEVLGIPVYYADNFTRQLVNEDANLIAQIRQHFGEESYTEGKLNRSYIASIVFSDSEKLELLNSLTHPAAIRAAEEWINKQTTAYAIKEAALLFESGSAGTLDFIIGVYSPLELRMQRTMLRDNVTREQVLQRMSKQIDEKMKMKLCDAVIVNDEENALIPQVLALHTKLLSRL